MQTYTYLSLLVAVVTVFISHNGVTDGTFPLMHLAPFGYSDSQAACGAHNCRFENDRTAVWSHSIETREGPLARVAFAKYASEASESSAQSQLRLSAHSLSCPYIQKVNCPSQLACILFLRNLGADPGFTHQHDGARHGCLVGPGVLSMLLAVESERSLSLLLLTHPTVCVLDRSRTRRRGGKVASTSAWHVVLLGSSATALF